MLSKWVFIAFLVAMLFVSPVIANQVGLNFGEGTIGVLGDYQKKGTVGEFEADAQAQRTDTLSLSGNVSLLMATNNWGLKPFASYSRGDVGNIFDGGMLVNFSLGGLDIAAGASFRGANPTDAGFEKRFDANDVEVEVRPEGYSPNQYVLPKVNNVNAAFNTGFEKWKIETDLTVYVPITEREVVPTVIISRSQTSIKIPGIENLSASFVVDARSYVHADGMELEFKPIGGIIYRF